MSFLNDLNNFNKEGLNHTETKEKSISDIIGKKPVDFAPKNKVKKEFTDEPEILEKKIKILIELIKESKNLGFFTGAGISTASGIASFRGEGGLAQKGILGLRESDLDFLMPSYSHQAIKILVDNDIAKYVLTSNHDNIHRKTGIPEEKMGELFGNAYIEECLKCHTLYERKTQVPTLGRYCEDETCKGRLVRTGVRFGQSVPEKAIKTCSRISKACDLAIIIGSSMTVNPFCSFASTPKKYVIINLQETPYDNDCTLKIHANCDDVMKEVMKELKLEIGSYEYKQEYVIGHTLKPFELFLKNPRINECCTCVKNVECMFASKKVKDMDKEKYKFSIKIPEDENEIVMKIQFADGYKIEDREILYNIDSSKDDLLVFELKKKINY